MGLELIPLHTIGIAVHSSLALPLGVNSASYRGPLLGCLHFHLLLEEHLVIIQLGLGAQKPDGGSLHQNDRVVDIVLEIIIVLPIGMLLII